MGRGTVAWAAGLAGASGWYAASERVLNLVLQKKFKNRQLSEEEELILKQDNKLWYDHIFKIIDGWMKSAREQKAILFNANLRVNPYLVFTESGDQS